MPARPTRCRRPREAKEGGCLLLLGLSINPRMALYNPSRLGPKVRYIGPVIDWPTFALEIYPIINKTHGRRLW